MKTMLAVLLLTPAAAHAGFVARLAPVRGVLVPAHLAPASAQQHDFNLGSPLIIGDMVPHERRDEEVERVHPVAPAAPAAPAKETIHKKIAIIADRGYVPTRNLSKQAEDAMRSPEPTILYPMVTDESSLKSKLADAGIEPLIQRLQESGRRLQKTMDEFRALQGPIEARLAEIEAERAASRKR